jgi:thiol:disulfide interchange protein DsbD
MARSPLPFVLAVACLGAVAGAPGASAEGPGNHTVFEAKVEPTTLGEDGKGTLVLTGKIEKEVHVFADQRFKLTPTASPGVSYGTHETPPAKDWRSKYLPDDPAEKVWFDTVELRIPFTVAPDAPTPTRVGVALVWESCNEEQCFEPERQTLAVSVVRRGVVATPEVAPPGSNGAGSAVLAAPAPGEPEADSPAAPEVGVSVLHLPTPDAGPVSVTLSDSASMLVTASAEKGKVKVRLEPRKGYHAYFGAEAGTNISVEPSEASGLEWKAVVEPFLGSTEVKTAVTFTIPYALSDAPPASGRVRVTWGVCEDDGKCHSPVVREVALRVGDPAAFPAEPIVPTAAATPTASSLDTGERGLLFEVIGEREKNWVERLWASLGLLILGPLFLTGVGLAFTPCVLPLIPITVSIVAGGRADLPRSRLTVLLTSYVVGLSTAFGTLGIVASLTGASISAAFESKPFLWSMASLFVLLGFGMFGVYELQPPAWLQRVQGERKGGSIPAAFLFGALAAVIASPCTGPVIAAMLVIAAQAGNAVAGFLMFFALGLGMGAVLFAAGALNFVMRPGPWMVWVRYVFGVLLVGMALYYLASSGLVSPAATYAIGLGVAVLAAVGIGRHLVRKEGEPAGAAFARGAKAAALVAVVTVVVALLTRPGEARGFAGGPGGHPDWIPLRDRKHLAEEVAKAKGRMPVVVDTTATWCYYCKKWEEFIQGDPELRTAFAKMARLQIDVTKDRVDLRTAVGVPPSQQPFFVFLDTKGRIRRDLDVDGPPDREKMLRVLRELGVAEKKE